MKIRAYATLRDVMGKRVHDAPMPHAQSVEDVLKYLTEQYPGLRAKLWDVNGNLTGYVTVLINGRSIEYLQGLATPVTDADSLALFPPVGGG